MAEPVLQAFVATGRFGADMAVDLVDDGPVTLVLQNWIGELVRACDLAGRRRPSAR